MDYSYYFLKDKIDIIFKKNGITFFKNSSNQFIFNKCPFCKTKKNKFYFDPSNTKWICFSCQNKGNILNLFSYLMNMSTRNAFHYLIKGVNRSPRLRLDRLVSVNLYSKHKKHKDISDFNIRDVVFDIDIKKFDLTTYDISKYKIFYQYLVKRGITKRMVKSFDIRFSTRKERIVFPVYYQKKLVGWQGRSIFDHIKPKALTEPSGLFKKSNFLFNFDNVIDSYYITIVEGPIDACKAINFNCISLFGKTLSEIQLMHIKAIKNLKRVYIALDPEEIKSIKKIYSALSPWYDCYLLDIEPGSDCGDKTVDEISKYFYSSKKYNYINRVTKCVLKRNRGYC